MDLYVLSDKLSQKIQSRIDKVHTRFPTVRFEEFIVIKDLHNMIMLRFINHDLLEISLDQLNDREVQIRALVGPEFLGNFMGSDYSHFGLETSQLKATLTLCNHRIPKQKYDYYPPYYKDINKDYVLLEKTFKKDLDIWEIQVDDYHINVLAFGRQDPVYQGSIQVTSIEKDDSYKGIIKAQLKAIKEHRSSLEVLLDYQS